jgi:hypothetical protein
LLKNKHVIQGGKTMKMKKVVAMTLAATMVLGSTLSVSAAPTDASDSTGSTVTGTGTVDYVNTTIYNVGLPTTTALALTVDPQGLTALENEKTATKEELASAAGKVTAASVVPITNGGSVPVKVSVEMQLTGNADSVASADAVNDATTKANNILLYAVPSAVDTKDEAGYSESSTGIVLNGASAVTTNFVIPAAGYVFSKDASGTTTYIRDDSDVHGTGLKFEGLVNTEADWSDFLAGGSKTIGLTAKFTFDHTLADSDVADDTEGAPAFMMAYAGTTVDVAPAEAAPSAASTMTYSKANGGTAAVSLGAGSLAATKATVAAGTAADGTFTAVTAVTPTVENGTLTIPTGMWAKKNAGDVMYVKLTFNDTAKTTAIITVTIAD